MNNNSIKNGVRFIAMWAWPVLGFYRGLNSYNYNYVKNKLYRHSNPFYIDKIVWGAVGTLIYLNPITFFFVLYKEVYRLEVNLRGIEDEKNTDYYNEVL